MNSPWFVVNKDLKKNILLVAQGENNLALMSDSLVASNAFWIKGASPPFPYNCAAKIRYRQADQNCEVNNLSNGKLKVKFEKLQRAVAPGQTIVFYKGDICLGNAIIESNSNLNKSN